MFGVIIYCDVNLTTGFIANFKLASIIFKTGALTGKCLSKCYLRTSNNATSWQYLETMNINTENNKQEIIQE